MIISGDKINKTGANSQHGRREHAAKLQAQARTAAKRCREVLIVCGLPGAGKSTQAKQHDAGRRLVIDTCALTAKHRAALVAAVRPLPVDCLVVLTDAKICAARRPHITGEDFARLREQWQPPRKNEGLRRVWYTQSNGDDDENNEAHAQQSDRSQSDPGADRGQCRKTSGGV